MRFFTKAIDQYDIGFRAFPKSFDLAYNKARLQYDITQQPRLVKLIAEPTAHLLIEARKSHIAAVDIDGNNTDALFNLAQLNASLSEAVLEAEGDVPSRKAEASGLLHQALDLLTRCYEAQERSLDDETLLADESSSSTNGQSVDDLYMEEATQKETLVWASLIEPVTEAVVFDTLLAQLNCLRSLCEIQSLLLNELPFIEAAYKEVAMNMQRLAPRSNHDREAVISRAAFQCAYASARFRLISLDIQSSDEEFSSGVAVFKTLPDLAGDAEALCAAGDAEVEFNASIEERVLELHEGSTEALAAINRLRWTHINCALDFFTAASKVPKVTNLARIHISRGDCELLRLRLGDEPFNYDFAEKSRDTLTRNAAVFYSAANKSSSSEGANLDLAETKLEIDVKLAIVASLRGDTGPFTTLSSSMTSKVTHQLDEIKDSGLVGGQTLKALHYLMMQRGSKVAGFDQD